MTRIALLAAGAASLMAASPALSQDLVRGAYAELGGGAVFEEDFDTLGLTGRVGYEWGQVRYLPTFIDAWALEGELFYGLSGDETENSFGVVDTEIEYAASASVRAVKHLGPVDGFARLGFSRASAEVDSSSQFDAFDDEEQDTDILLGVGGLYKLNTVSGVRGDFTLQNDFEALSLTYHRRF